MNAPIDVYYDASCPLCRAEIHALVAVDPEQRLRLHDCSVAGFSDPDALRVGIDRHRMMQAMHVRDADGRWHAAVGAFVVMYRAVGIESVAAVWAHPWLKPLWDRIYPFIARHRMTLSRLGFSRVVRSDRSRGAAARRCASDACGDR